MSLRDTLRVFARRWILIGFCVLLGLSAGLAVTLLSKETYEATAQIFVSASDATDVTQLAQGNTFTQARVQSYTAVATSPAVTEPVIEQLQLTVTPQSLAARISADAPLNKVLINLHVRDDSPIEAAQLANAVAARFSTVVQDIEQTSAAVASPVKLTVTQPAQVPDGPVTPNRTLNLLIGFGVGLIAGLLAAIAFEVLANTIETPEELGRQAMSPVLAAVPWDRTTENSVIAQRLDPHGPQAEAFRQLRTNLHFIDVDNPPKVIAICSALPGEGKTHIAINLAAALAEVGQRVCLVEADLRRPTVAPLLDLIGNVGLTSVLVGDAQLEDVLQNAGQNFAVLTSGPVPPNPTELLVSNQFSTVLSYLSARVDVVVIDTAPLIPVADGAEVAAQADATVVVVRARKTTREQLRRALGALTNVDVKPVGVTLSMVAARRTSYAYYYSSASGYRPSPAGSVNRRGSTSRVDVSSTES